MVWKLVMASTGFLSSLCIHVHEVPAEVFLAATLTACVALLEWVYLCAEWESSMSDVCRWVRF